MIAPLVLYIEYRGSIESIIQLITKIWGKLTYSPIVINIPYYSSIFNENLSAVILSELYCRREK